MVFSTFFDLSFFWIFAVFLYFYFIFLWNISFYDFCTLFAGFLCFSGSSLLFFETCFFWKVLKEIFGISLKFLKFLSLFVCLFLNSLEHLKWSFAQCGVFYCYTPLNSSPVLKPMNQRLISLWISFSFFFCSSNFFSLSFVCLIFFSSCLLSLSFKSFDSYLFFNFRLVYL